MGLCFLLDQERAYCGASALFQKMERLEIDPVLYELPPHYIFSPETLHYYLDSVLNELRGKPQNEDYFYVQRVCESLRKWADRGLIVHVID